ncbi:uncharacterized protein LOC116956688 isoform X2 [Petromyzon marinus]|uniref:uncharacterized protein LOC116956688 isoform X2 n=1 Tax=Petromyzon marinus TaxID=7757 RepID=UPI003F70E636
MEPAEESALSCEAPVAVIVKQEWEDSLDSEAEAQTPGDKDGESSPSVGTCDSDGHADPQEPAARARLPTEDGGDSGGNKVALAELALHPTGSRERLPAASRSQNSGQGLREQNHDRRVDRRDGRWPRGDDRRRGEGGDPRTRSSPRARPRATVKSERAEREGADDRFICGICWLGFGDPDTLKEHQDLHAAEGAALSETEARPGAPDGGEGRPAVAEAAADAAAAARRQRPRPKRDAADWPWRRDDRKGAFATLGLLKAHAGTHEGAGPPGAARHTPVANPGDAAGDGSPPVPAPALDGAAATADGRRRRRRRERRRSFEVAFESADNGGPESRASEESTGSVKRRRGEAEEEEEEDDDDAVATLEWDDEPAVSTSVHAMLSPPPAHCTADVWEHFGFPLSESGAVDRTVTICRVCGVRIKYYNTTNMRKHLQRRHSDVFGTGVSYNCASGGGGGEAGAVAGAGIPLIFKRVKFSAKGEGEFANEAGASRGQDTMRYALIANAGPAAGKRLGTDGGPRTDAPGARDGDFDGSGGGSVVAFHGAEATAERRPRQSCNVAAFSSRNGGQEGAACEALLTPKGSLATVKQEHGEAEDAVTTLEWDDEPAVSTSVHTMLSPPPAHCTADVWEHFGFPLSESGAVDRTVTVCRVCGVRIKYYNTTNMRKHLQRRHSDVFGTGVSYNCASGGGGGGEAGAVAGAGIPLIFKRVKFSAKGEGEFANEAGASRGQDTMRYALIANAGPAAGKRLGTDGGPRTDAPGARDGDFDGSGGGSVVAFHGAEATAERRPRQSCNVAAFSSSNGGQEGAACEALLTPKGSLATVKQEHGEAEDAVTTLEWDDEPAVSTSAHAMLSPPPAHCTADVWEHFGFPLSESGAVDRSMTICRVCGVRIKYNTTNMRKHLQRWHPDVFRSGGGGAGAGGGFEAGAVPAAFAGSRPRHGRSGGVPAICKLLKLSARRWGGAQEVADAGKAPGDRCGGKEHGGGGYGGDFDGAAAAETRPRPGSEIAFGGGGDNGGRQRGGVSEGSLDVVKREHGETMEDAVTTTEWDDEPPVATSAHAMLSPPPAHCTADVWEHFGFPLSESGAVDRTVTVCRVCDVRIKYYNTTNMRKHLQRWHPDVFGSGGAGGYDGGVGGAPAGNVPGARPEHDQPPGVPAVFKRQRLAARREQELTEKVGRFVALEMRPRVVDNAGFQDLIQFLEPKYQLPSRLHFSDRVIPDLYAKVASAVNEELEGAASVALTSEVWTSGAAERRVTVAAHFVTAGWKLERFVLRTRPLDGAAAAAVPAAAAQEGAARVADVLAATAAEWNLHRPHGYIPLVTDGVGAGTAAAAGASRESALRPRIGCFAHALNRAAQRGLQVPALARLLAEVRRTVGFFRRSVAATLVLNGRQQALGLPVRELAVDAPGRWSSAYEMLECYVEQYPAIVASVLSEEVLRDLFRELPPLADETLADAEDVCAALEPVMWVTRALCEEKGPTVSTIYPYTRRVVEAMAPERGDSELVRDVKKAVRGGVERRHAASEVEDFLKESTVLDARFKSHLDDATRLLCRRSLVRKTVGLHEALRPDGRTKWGVGDRAGGGPTSDESPAGPAEEKKRGGAEGRAGDVRCSGTAANGLRDAVLAEMELYEQEEPIALDEDPLDWWAGHEFKFPQLALAAKHYLGVPGTCVPSEWVFTAAGDIVTARRAQIAVDEVDRLVFLGNNLR